MLLLGVSKPEASASCINAWQQAQEMVWCTSKGFSCQWVNDVPLDATWNWWDWRATRKRNDEKCLQWHQRKQGTIRNTRSKKNGATGSEIIWCKSLASPESSIVKSSQSLKSSELRATSVQHRAVASLGTRPVNSSKRTSMVQYAGSASVAKW